jgi:hypothetical protein
VLLLPRRHSSLTTIQSYGDGDSIVEFRASHFLGLKSQYADFSSVLDMMQSDLGSTDDYVSFRLYYMLNYLL